MNKSGKTQQIISGLMKEARQSMDYGHFEDAAIKLQNCLDLEDGPVSRAIILNDLGYCFLRLGWFEEAVKVYTELLKANPFDNDSRFYLASAYASLRRTGDAIKKLRAILASDPNDVLAYHDLALCYRDLGWIKESLEEMKRAKAKAMVYGNTEERKVVISSLAHLKYEIENGDEDGSKEVLLLLILLLVINKGRKGKLSKLAKDKAS